MSYPILGLKLRTVGIKLGVLGADAQTLWTIAAAAPAMFVWQLFRDRIPLNWVAASATRSTAAA